MRKGGLREAVLVVAFAVAATAVLTHPLVLQMNRLGRVNTSDGQFSIWNVAWVAHALLTEPRQVFNANIYYPHQDTLAYSEPNLGAGVLAIPVWALTHNPYFAHNSAVVLGFILSACGAYVLARRLTGHRGAALVAGLAFAFCPFVFARTAHVQLLMIWGLPWSLWACHRLIDRPSLSGAVVLALVLAAQGLSCGYYGMFAGLSVATAILYFAVVRGLWRSPSYWMYTTVAAGLAVAMILPALWPYLSVNDADFSRSLDDARDWAANWQSYFASGARAHQWLLPLVTGFREVLFPGFVTTILAFVAVFLALSGRLRAAALDSADPGAPAVRPRETVGLYAVLAIGALWCSFGPDGGLYTILYRTIPAFSFMRAPSRMGIVVTFALVMCAATAVAALARSSGRRRFMLPAVVGLAVVGELWTVPLPIPEVDPTVPRVYQILAKLPRGPVCEFPFFYRRTDFPRHAAYMLESTAHWLPLINGYSDHIPSDFREMVIDLSSFPTRASLALLQKRRVRYAVLHLNWYDSRSREKLMERLDAYREFVAPIFQEGDVWLYQIIKWPPLPKPKPKPNQPPAGTFVPLPAPR